MSTGTPALTMSGASKVVVFEEIHSAFPFAGFNHERTFQERQLRVGTSNMRKVVRVFDEWGGHEDTLEFTVPYATVTMYNDLRAMHTGNPPEVAVTYLHLTNAMFDFISMSNVPDEWDWDNDPSHELQIRLQRQSV